MRRFDFATRCPSTWLRAGVLAAAEYLKKQGVANPEKALEEYIRHKENMEELIKDYSEKAEKKIDEGQRNSAKQKEKEAKRYRRNTKSETAYF